MEVEAIKRMGEGIPIHIKHTLREGNTIADFFANMTVNFASTSIVENFKDIPIIPKKILNMDKINMPFLRMIQLDN